jgi:hypothetical protein
MASGVRTVGLRAPFLCSTFPISLNILTVLLRTRTRQICLQELDQTGNSAVSQFSVIENENTITKVRLNVESYILFCVKISLIVTVV